jgi:ATP-binding cassette subfamily B protein
MQAKKEEKKKMNFKDVRDILAHYFSITKEYRSYLWLMLLTYGLGSILMEVVVLLIYRKIIDHISLGQTEDVWFLVGILGAVFLSHYTLFRLGDILMARYQVPAYTKLSRYAFAEIQKHSYEFFADRFVGGLTSQIKRYTDAFISLSEGLVYIYWMNLLALIGLITSTFFFSWKLGAVFLVNIIIVIAIAIPLLKKRMQFDEEAGKISSKVSGQYSDVLSNIMNVKLFTGFGTERELFRAITEEWAVIEKKSWHVWIITIAIQNGFMLFARYVTFAYALYLWSRGEISVGTVVLMVGYFQALFGMLWTFVRSASGALRDLANAKEMIDEFHVPIQVTDTPHAIALTALQGKVSFEAVDFSYGKQDEKVFEDLSFTIAPGEHVGLVGPSGGGKSTITKLLLRFADVTGGAITIDGQDIRQVTQDSLRQQVAYVPQDPTLFHRTLLENIAYGNPEATEEMIFAAAKKAHAHDFISKLPEGYQTEVGERGIKLSGGQRQRIAIARAVLKDAPILIMDEATSALDTQSEHAIREALEEIMPGKTVVMIAHRLSTVEKLDRIIVLGKDGKIAEEGTHQELVAKQGLYATLWNHQVGGFLGEEDEE